MHVKLLIKGHRKASHSLNKVPRGLQVKGEVQWVGGCGYYSGNCI